MEQVKTNWLQKAVAIIGVGLLAFSLALLLVPSKAWAAEIDSVTISEVANPEAGQTIADPSPAVTFSPSVSGATISMKWMEDGSTPTSSTFEAGHGYKIFATITLPAGDTFKTDGNWFEGEFSWTNAHVR